MCGCVGVCVCVCVCVCGVCGECGGWVGVYLQGGFAHAKYLKPALDLEVWYHVFCTPGMYIQIKLGGHAVLVVLLTCLILMMYTEI